MPRIFSWHLAEKIALLAFVGVIFAHVLDAAVTTTQLVVATAVVVTVNVAVSHAFAVREFHWRSNLKQFLIMAVINFAALVLYVGLRSRFDARFDVGKALFLVLLYTLLILLYDRYTQIRVTLDTTKRMPNSVRLARAGSDQPST